MQMEDICLPKLKMMEQTNTPYATKLKELGELENYIGKELGLTEWMTIEQERINSFAEST